MTQKHDNKKKERNLKKQITKIFYDDDTVVYNDDTVVYDDDTYDDDDDDDAYTYHSNVVRGKAMGMGMMGMMGMGMWKKKHDSSSHYPHSDFYPSARDIAFLDDQFFDDHFFEDDDCELVAFNETFGMSSADLFLAPDTTVQDPGNPSYPGTVFLFEREYLLGPDGVSSNNGTTVSGSCTRTESGNDGNGAGLCTFIFVDDEGFSINVNGLLVGPLGGKLAITGGTGGLVGVVGEMDFLPIYEDGKTIGDIFLDPIRYEVMAELGLIVCP